MSFGYRGDVSDRQPGQRLADVECLARFMEVLELAGPWTPAQRSRLRALLADPVAARLVRRTACGVPGASAQLYRYVSERLDHPVSAVYDPRVTTGLAKLARRMADRP